MNWENLRGILFSDLSGVYSPIGTPLDNPARLIKIVNTTDVNVFISTNGTDDKDIVPAHGFFLYDIATNKTEQSCLFLDQGSTLYVRSDDVPTLGSVYLVSIYASSF